MKQRILTILLLLFISILLSACKQVIVPEPEVTIPKSSEKRTHFAHFSDAFRFSAEMPEKWNVEFVKEINSLNLSDSSSSQIFIRFFEANDFLTLKTVDVLTREAKEINGHMAVRYEIEKKSNVPEFPYQPKWRNQKHKLIDIRFSKNNPSFFYVFAYNPELDDAIFDQFINSLIFDNDPKSFQPPLEKANERVTKKPFGIFITKENSPVKPERFTGYHTGTDFESLPEEESNEIPFFAICGGKLREKKTVSGYGGVMVQECLLEDLPVTVIYGHIKKESILKEIGAYLLPGEKMGVLGKDMSEETDFERRHLHLGIHKNSTIDIRGYVEKENELENFLSSEMLVSP